jgi:HTH-type transcriptional regulator/antitoxin HigA
MKNLFQLKNELEYQAALDEASKFFDNEPSLGSQEAFKFESLLNLIDDYESKNYVVDPPDPVRAA